MTKVLSIEIYRKESSLAKVELSSGDVYNIGFLGLQPVHNKEQYSKALERILDAFEKGDDADLSNYLSYQLANEKLEIPLYVSPDRNRERERIGQRIRDLRMGLGMEAKKLARLSQIDAANVSRIEQGKYSVGLDILCKIALALDSRVDIVPNWSYSGKAKFLSMTRKVWVIPTMGAHYNPYWTLPGCRFSLWPNTYGDTVHIGDVVYFYLSETKEYSGPHLISDTQMTHDELGVYADIARDWPVSENGKYLRVDYYSNLSEADQIHIREAVQKIKGEPTELMEIKM